MVTCSTCCDSYCPGQKIDDQCYSCHNFKHDNIMLKYVGNYSVECSRGYSVGNTSLALGETTDTLLGFCLSCSTLGIKTATTGAFTLLTVTEHGVLCPSNATGFLCSKCASGTYHNLGRRCVECNNWALHWFLFILAEFVPITLVFLALLFTNFSLVSGPLNASIFFAQTVTTTMDLTGDGFIPLTNITGSSKLTYALTATYNLIYQPFNLNFAYPFTNDLCLLTPSSYLPYFAIQYLVALYPLLLLLLLLLIQLILKKELTFIQLVREDLLHQNVFASIIILCYAKFILVSAYIMAPNLLYNQYGNNVKTVLLYDPSVTYLKHGHSAYVAIAIVVYVFAALLPVFLLLLRYSKTQHSHLGESADEDTTPDSALTETKLEKAIATIINPFHADFKKARKHSTHRAKRWRSIVCGLHKDHAWMPAFYLFLRIVLLTVFTLAPSYLTFITQFLIQQSVCILTAAILIIAKPYKQQRRWVNRLDAIVFLLLIFINMVSMYQYFLTSTGQDLSPAAFAIQYTFIFLPGVWMMLYISYCIYAFSKNRFCKRHGTASSINLTESIQYGTFKDE